MLRHVAIHVKPIDVELPNNIDVHKGRSDMHTLIYAFEVTYFDYLLYYSVSLSVLLWSLSDDFSLYCTNYLIIVMARVWQKLKYVHPSLRHEIHVHDKLI